MGGYGTWHWAAATPNRFAAIAPICGGGDPGQAFRLKDLPIWAFHGAKDYIVPLSESVDMVEAVEGVGGNVKLTIYPDAAHDSWTETYHNPLLYDWFLTETRK
jgi:predicted peptidase